MSAAVKLAFERETITLPLAKILPTCVSCLRQPGETRPTRLSRRR